MAPRHALALVLLVPACGAPIAPAPPVPAPQAALATTATAAPTGAPSLEPSAVEPPPRVSNRHEGWTLFHADAARTGAIDVPAILRPRVLWHAQVGILGWLNSPIVTGSVVLVPSSGDKHNLPDPRDGVAALDLATGAQRWHVHFDNDANGLAIAGGRAIAGSDDGKVYAIDPSKGQVEWTRKLSGKVYASPLPAGDRVIVADASGTLYALSTADGAVAWKVKLDGAIRGGASSDATAIYAASQRGEVAALRPDGSVAWRVQLKPLGVLQIYAAPVIGASAVYIAYARDTYYNTPAILALDKTSGRVVWSAKGDARRDWGNIRTAPVLVGGTLIWADAYSGDIAGVDAATGALRFRRTVGACYFPSWASPAAAGDVVYVPRYDGALYAVRARDGGVDWKVYLGDEKRVGSTLPSAIATQRNCAWDVPEGAPLYAPVAIADDGTVLAGSGEGILYAIGETRSVTR